MYLSLCTETTIMQIDFLCTPLPVSMMDEASFVGRPACMKSLNSPTYGPDPINYFLEAPQRVAGPTQERSYAGALC